MNTGIVMEITGRKAVVMTRDGQFVQLKSRPGFQIGQEITVDRDIALPKASRIRWMATAAAVLLIFVIAFSALSSRLLNGPQAVAAAYLSIDINPSVELALDNNSHVITAVGLNDDGLKLLEGLEAAGRPVEVVMEELIVRAEPYIDQYISTGTGEIVIASTIIAEQFEFDQEVLQEKMKAIIDQFILQRQGGDVEVGGGASQNTASGGNQQPSGNELQPSPGTAQGPDVPSIEGNTTDDPSRVTGQLIKVATISVPKELREDALAKGISPGKLAVGLIIADKMGHELTLQEVETQSLKQLAENVGGLDGLLQQDKTKLQSDIEQLFSNSQKGKGNIGKVNPASLSTGDPDERRGQAGRGNGPAKDKDDDDHKKGNDHRGQKGRGNGPAKDKDDDDRKKGDDHRGQAGRGNGPAKDKDDNDDRKKGDESRGQTGRGNGPAKDKNDDDRKKGDDHRGQAGRGNGPAKDKDDNDDRKKGDESRGQAGRGNGPAKDKDDGVDNRRGNNDRGNHGRGQGRED